MRRKLSQSAAAAVRSKPAPPFSRAFDFNAFVAPRTYPLLVAGESVLFIPAPQLRSPGADREHWPHDGERAVTRIELRILRRLRIVRG